MKAPFHITVLSLLLFTPLFSNTLTLQQNAEIRYNGLALGVTYTGLEYALIDEADPVATLAGTDVPAVIPLTPPGSDGETQFLMHFDQLVGSSEVWQIPPGSTITSAYLVLPLQSDGSDIQVFDLEFPWDPSTVTWNNYGDSPLDGINPPLGEAVSGPDLIFPVPVPEMILDITPVVQSWVDDPLLAYGLGLLNIGAQELPLQSPNFLDPTQLDNGIPFYIEVGEWGVRDTFPPLFALTDPLLLNEGALVHPVLIVDFLPPVNPLDPLDGFVLEPPVVLPPLGLPLPTPPRIQWEGIPGMLFKVEFNDNLHLDNWLCVDGLLPVELLPGQFMCDFPLPLPPQNFGRILPVDEDGDGFLDNRMGRSEAAAANEDCPENDLGPLFKHVERTGRLLLAAQNEQERNALVEEIRTVQLIYEFALRFGNGVYGVPFQKTLEALLQGKKPNVPNQNDVERMEMFKDALKYIRFMLWWEMTYNEDLTPEEVDDIRQLHDDLVTSINQLCQLEPFGAEDLVAFEQICNQTIQKIQDALSNKAAGGASRPGGVILKKLLVKLLSEGVDGLWERLLSNVIGKSFVDGAFKGTKTAISAIFDIINAIGVFLSEGEIENAKREFNKALCRLHDEACELDKFTLVDNGADSFQVTHSGSIHPKMKTTTVEPFAYRWKPSSEPDAQEGDGEWVEEPLRFPLEETVENPTVTSKTFNASDAESSPGSSTRHHEFVVTMPDIEPGEKAYVVYKVTRRWCTPDGETVVQIDNYFRGVVKQ